MRLIMGLCLLALLAAGAAPFFLTGPDGQPLMTLDELMPDPSAALDDLERTARDAAERFGNDNEGASDGGAVVHRWQDENGVWHFSSEAPVGRESETLVLDGNINIVPATQVTGTSGASATSTTAAPSGALTPNPLELMRQAEAIREASEARNAQLEALAGGDGD